MLGSNHANRMVKIKVARAPQDNYSPNSASSTVAEASSPTHSSVSTSLPTSTATLAGVITFLGVALILVLGVCLYRRRRNRSRKSNSPAINFDPNAFTVEKKSMQQVTRQTTEAKSPGYQASISSRDSDDTSTSESPGWKPQGSPKFRVTNENRGSAPALPKILADKKRPSRSKPWTESLNLNLDDIVRSPPPSYDLANSAGPEFLVPIPTQPPMEKARSTPTPPTPPANRKLSRSRPSTSPVADSSSSQYVQTLTVPQQDASAPPTVPSPARSESFAPKDLVLPAPTSAASKSKFSPPASANPFASREDSYYTGSKSPRMMHVIAHYTPTLADELRVHVGDTVRVLEEYKDGWCFAQYVGKVDAPKGVVPLICLEDRLRMVPVAHSRSPNGSLSSLSSWRR